MNINIRDFLLKLIEDKYPHISLNIRIFWGSEEFVEYIDSIIINTRNEPREGFDSTIFEAIILLSNIHSEEYDFKSNRENPFTLR